MTEPDEARESPGMVLRRARLLQGLSQTAVAREMRIGNATISAWEHGRTSPSPKYIRLYARLLNMDERELIEISERIRRSKQTEKHNDQARPNTGGRNPVALGSPGGLDNRPVDPSPHKGEGRERVSPTVSSLDQKPEAIIAYPPELGELRTLG